MSVTFPFAFASSWVGRGIAGRTSIGCSSCDVLWMGVLTLHNLFVLTNTTVGRTSGHIPLHVAFHWHSGLAFALSTQIPHCYPTQTVWSVECSDHRM